MAELNISPGQNSKWLQCDLSELFDLEKVQKFVELLTSSDELSFTEDTSPPPQYDFPDFGANRLQPTALKHLCLELSTYLRRTVSPMLETPSIIILLRMGLVWERILEAFGAESYTRLNIQRVIAALQKEEQISLESSDASKEMKEPSKASAEKKSGNEVLIEMGVKTGLSVVFSLLKQAWAQLAWQKQLELTLQQSGAVIPFSSSSGVIPVISLPNEVLKSILEILKGIPPLSLSNKRALSSLSESCLTQSHEFLEWIVRPDSYVDNEGKRLAMEIMLSVTLQYGDLVSLLEWISKMLAVLALHQDQGSGGSITLSKDFCDRVLSEIRRRTHLGAADTEVRETRTFSPKQLSEDGHVHLMDLLLFLCDELCAVSSHCTSFFSHGVSSNAREDGKFISESCEVFAFGSNSSSQLAMGSTEKFHKATLMQHMANVQVIEAGQYCSFLIFSDGSMKACGKGSYGRLGLGNSDSQSTLKEIGTFPPGTVIRRLASSRGSDGHSQAITSSGEVYSWGDGNYGKLGHGDNATQKIPKLISAFTGKVVRHVACGNRHSAAVTIEGDLYTWGEGDHGRLGHGNTSSVKTPTKVVNIGPVQQAGCGVAHTLALGIDGLTVWSFGSGDSGKLGHGDTTKQTTPKMIEALRGIMCQKVCAASQFSLVLTAGGKVYSFGNGSGVGKGTTEPRQYTPWLIEPLEGEMVIDISTGDGHCLALTQRGEVYAWGTNSMGQCGQGHSNGSIVTPSKVQGLEGVQVQQVSAGTSHSMVWTAVPLNRRASAMWHWPYCVSVTEKTFQILLNLLNQFGNIGDEKPTPPFHSKEVQESFLCSLLSLTRTHLGLVAPLGPSCVRMACGAQVKPLRSLLFKLVDSQLPPALDQVASDALEVGSSVLLPPVVDRLDLLLSLLPEQPSLINTLTTGQRRQLEILLSGFSERSELVGLLVDSGLLEQGTTLRWTGSIHVKKVFILCERIILYIRTATFCSLEGQPLSAEVTLGSQLLTSFQELLLSVYINVLSLLEFTLSGLDSEQILLSDQLHSEGTNAIVVHFSPFYDILKEHSLAVLGAITEAATQAQDPLQFLLSKQDVLFGFLGFEFPQHVAFSCPNGVAFDALFHLGDLLLEMAKSVHKLMMLLPQELIETLEKEELQWEPTNEKPEKIILTKLRPTVEHPWRRLADLERLLCFSAAKMTETAYTSTSTVGEEDDGYSGLHYCPMKSSGSGGAEKTTSSMTLLSSHLLSNGAVGDEQEIAQAIYSWVSLCKSLPGYHPASEYADLEDQPDDELTVTVESWSDYVADFNQLARKDSDLGALLPLNRSAAAIPLCDVKEASPLLALAAGAQGNEQAQRIYDNMMDLANYRDWNTCSDEKTVPQLRQVSCAALACLLKHTGLFTYAARTTFKPKKKLMDVYRAVFSLRREVFTNRPIPNDAGKTSPEDERWFQTQCNAICVTLMFLVCVLDPALPEENEPIVPQIATSSSPTMSSTSAEDIVVRSPGAGQTSSAKGALRLFSQPVIRDDTAQDSKTSTVPPAIVHTGSLSSPDHDLQGWSLSAVKQALSHLRWQRDRLDHLHASATSLHGPDTLTPHQKITSIIVDLVGLVFSQQEGKGKLDDSEDSRDTPSTDLMNRVVLIKQLIGQRRRAMHRRNALQRVVQFLTESESANDILPSARLIFLSNCLNHTIHCSDHITAAPSVLQHEVKSLSHTLLQNIINRLSAVDVTQFSESSVYGLKRELLLALQWVNFEHHPSDLQLLFTGSLYDNITALSGVVSTQIAEDPCTQLAPAPSSDPQSILTSRLKMASLLSMQLLTIRVGMNAEVLKSRTEMPDILFVVSNHLFGQLEGYITTNNPSVVKKWELQGCSVDKREHLLGDYLRFINTLSATHEAIRSVLASETWFGTLLRIVDIDTSTGVPVVSSLKTRLLALQVLGGIMAELSDNSTEAHAKCTKIIEDFLELMYRCMFLAPLSLVQSYLSPQPSLQSESPLGPSQSHAHLKKTESYLETAQYSNCTSVRDNSDNVVESEGSGEGFIQLLPTLTSGKYTWKVTIRSANIQFRVGIAQTPLPDNASRWNCSWCIQMDTGDLYRNGEPTGDTLFTLAQGDMLTLEYDASSNELSLGKNSEELKKVFNEVVAPGKELSPFVQFLSSEGPRKIILHPMEYVVYPLMSHLYQREQLASGYPLLSPTNVTLIQTVVNILYQLQSKEPWSKAIAQVVTSKLSEMDVLIHRLLDLEADMSSSPDHTHSASSLSLLLAQFTQVVCPSLALIGGVDTGYCLGRSCQLDDKGDQITATLAGIPDADQRVEVQEQVTTDTAKVKKRTVSLSDVRLSPQTHFSLPLILERLTPSLLLNLAHLAGYLDRKHSLPVILQRAHSKNNMETQEIAKCLSYNQLCSSTLQMAATKSLHTILFEESIIQLLNYKQPTVDVIIAGGYKDHSELAEAVKEVVRCLSSRAVKPSPLRVTLRMLELERVHAILSNQCLTSIADHIHKNNVPASESFKSGLSTERIEDIATQESMDDLPTQQLGESVDTSPTVPPPEEARADANRPSTPPLMNNLMEMGFTRPQINVAMERCEVPPNSTEEIRTQLIVAWILEHPNAVSEEEARQEQSHVGSDTEEERRRRREEDEQQQQQQEADQTAAANEFLSIVGDMLDTCKSPTISSSEEIRKDTKHAPDLLEGPDVNDDVPDVNLSGLDCSPQSLKSLLSALGLSQKRPTPKRFEFTSPDPLGGSLCKSLADVDETERDHKVDAAPLTTETDFYRMSSTCDHIVDQAQKLRHLTEHLDALDRIASATQTLVARRVTMLAIASLSTESAQAFISGLQALDLIDIKLLVRLLRLVHAGRIDGTPGSSFTLTLPSSLLPLQGLKCLSSAISTVIIENGSSAGSQLMQACSRDLLAAAVGGAELLHPRPSRRRRQRRDRTDKPEAIPSDVSVLSNPNFTVSQSLVQTLAESTGKIVDRESSAAVLQMIDALAACLFSSKLEPEHRFWALEQILKVFATTVSDERSGVTCSPEGLVVPSHLEHLTGHKGQIMVCAENKRQNCIVSIGEDNCLLLWNLVPGGPTQPEITTLPFPDVEANSLEALMLPNLTQSFNQTCIAGAINEAVCVWRLKDGKVATEKFPELITTLQWKPKQKDGESPLLLVGLIDGGVELVEVLRSSVNLPHELQTIKIEESTRGAVCSLCWSPDSTMFAVASVTGSVQIYQGSGRDYSLANEIKEIQATCMYWSPEGSYLTTLDEDGTLKLWDMKEEIPSLAHSFDAYSTNTVTWHPEVSAEGDMLLASGSKDCGVVHVWLVHAGQAMENEIPVKRGLLSHVQSLEGHSAPITCLEFSESAALLASGCKAGSVRIWDLKTCSLIKYATRSVGEVVHLSWTAHGLAICYKNTMSLCLLPPGPDFYLGERCIHNCLPTLHLHAITEMEKAPCLTALLKNLHHVLLDQYQYEQAELSSSQQLVHSEYLQLLTALAVGLGLHPVLVSPPHPPHLPPPPPPKQWTWLSNFVNAVSLAESLTRRSAMPAISELQCLRDVEPLPTDAKYQPTDNSAWTLSMDREILEWISKEPQDWWQKTQSTVYTWGKGSWNQLGTSTRENSSPALAEEWKDVQQIVAGSYCTYAVRFDGTVSSVGEGSYGRLGHGGSESETKMRTISALQGIPVVQLVAGSRVSTSTDEGFALALSDSGDVYSWGKGYKGRLGHSSTENVRSPKMVDALGGKDIKMISCCDYHSAAISTIGHLYTFGSKENGKLGHGRDVPSGSTGNVTRVSKFLDSDQTTDMGDIRIGYVSCGQMFTLAITEDGRHVYGFGKSDNYAFGLRDITGDHYFPMLLNHLTPFGPFVKAVSGNRVSALLNLEGKVCQFGKLYDSQGQGTEAEFVNFPNNEKVIDLACAAQFMVALTEPGNVYYWGKMQYGVESPSAQSSPKLIEALSGKGLKQVSAGVRHCTASNTTLPVRGVTNIAIPSAVPSQYSALREVPCQAIHARLLLLNHFAKMITTSWRLFSIHSRPRSESARFHINPLVDDTTRSLLSPVATESMMAGVMSRTMLIKQHGPTITVQRISQDDRSCKPVLSQIANQILQKEPKDLRCHSRAWKVNLVGEGADDAGGVFDETIAQMCEEMENGTVNLLIQAPNARSKTGFNTDRYVFNPACTSTRDLKHLKFLGILLGVAMRTKKPLDLHLAQPMWKLLAGMNLTADDLEEVDLMFMRTLYSIRDVHKTDITEDDFSEMIPIEKFEAQSMNGNFVPIVPGGGNIHLTYQNRKEYVDKALQFRLHELDQQVTAIREGMSLIVPVPLLSLYTAKMLESAVCGNEDVDLQMLKKVVRYRDGTSQEDSVVQWLWQTLESFTVEERVLFLRFVSGRSRLPTRVSEIPQRFQISVSSGQTSDSLPTAQTCFFQLRLPNYSSQELLAERLRYAIKHCRSIDMDTYMLRRGGSGDYYDDSDDLYDYGSD